MPASAETRAGCIAGIVRSGFDHTTACTVASKAGISRSFGIDFTVVVSSRLNAFSLAVEKAKKISPEPLLPRPPTMPTPRGILWAILFN